MKLEDMPVQDQEKVCAWIRENIRRGRNARSAYGLKQPLTRQTGIYITDAVMCEALAREGYQGKAGLYRLKVRNNVNRFSSML